MNLVSSLPVEIHNAFIIPVIIINDNHFYEQIRAVLESCLHD